MWTSIRLLWYLNYASYLIVFIISLFTGTIIALSTVFRNREKRKRGFRNFRLFGKDKQIDKEISAGLKSEDTYRINLDSDIYRGLLSDEQEYHSNKKF